MHDADTLGVSPASSRDVVRTPVVLSLYSLLHGADSSMDLNSSNLDTMLTVLPTALHVETGDLSFPGNSTTVFSLPSFSSSTQIGRMDPNMRVEAQGPSLFVMNTDSSFVHDENFVASTSRFHVLLRFHILLTRFLFYILILEV